jgi:hypothetical protein
MNKNDYILGYKINERLSYGRDASQKSITGDACCILTIR